MKYSGLPTLVATYLILLATFRTYDAVVAFVDSRPAEGGLYALLVVLNLGFGIHLWRLDKPVTA